MRSYNFYRKFLKGFLALAKSFIDLFKKEWSFEWKDKQQVAFDLLKEKLTFSMVLRFPNFSKPFEMHTNANRFAIGRVLMQEGHPIAFESKKL
jgi:hypothetical protein